MECDKVTDRRYSFPGTVTFLATGGREEADAKREFEAELAEWIAKEVMKVEPKGCPERCKRRVVAVERPAKTPEGERLLSVTDQAMADATMNDPAIWPNLTVTGVDLNPTLYGFRIRGWRFGEGF
jgi:hypothetical protein